MILLGRVLTGREIICTPIEKITSNNIIEVLEYCIPTFEQNRSDIDYLYRYVKGQQPILMRTKNIRPDINNKIVVNKALEIITFKTGYLLGEPVQYVNKKTEDDNLDDLTQLNKWLSTLSKDALDRELAEWFHICGVGYRIVVPNTNPRIKAPFRLHTLDPRETFVIRKSGFTKEVLAGVIVVHYKKVHEDGSITFEPMYCVYTNNEYFEIKEKKVVKKEVNRQGIVPIIEYRSNTVLMGEFEMVLPLLDALNIIRSNRVDGVEQFIQSLIKFINVDIDNETFKSLMEMGAIKLTGGSDNVKQDVEFMSQEMNQTQIQTLEDAIIRDIETITGLPNRKGGASTSDTGAAVIMRDGWSDAEARAKSTELIFKKSEKELISLMLDIIRITEGIDINIADIEVRFTRRNYENILQKSQVLTSMLKEPKIDPKLAFVHSGMFIDPDLAYSQSKKYYEEWQSKMALLQNTPTEDFIGGGISDKSQGNNENINGNP